MTRWRDRLEAIRLRQADRPPVAEIMRLPDIDGWKPGRVFVEVAITRDLFSSGGQAFGGYLSCLADQTSSQALQSLLADDEYGLTVQLSMDFIKPVRESSLLVEATVTSKTSQMARVYINMSVGGETHCEAHALLVVRKSG